MTRTLLAPTRILVPLLAALSLACPSKGGDGGDDAATETDTDTGAAQCPEHQGTSLFDYGITIDGVTPDVGDDIDLPTLSCTVVDDGVLEQITLDCGGTSIVVSLSSEVLAQVSDVAGASVSLLFIQRSSWNYASDWLNLTFYWPDDTYLELVIVDAESLLPSSGWSALFSMAIGDTCPTDGNDEYYADQVVVARNETAEAWPGEMASVPGVLSLWVSQSGHAGPNYPAGDGPTAWYRLVYVGNLTLVPTG